MACSSASWRGSGRNTDMFSKSVKSESITCLVTSATIRFAHHQAQVFDRSRPADGAIAHEAGRLVVPLGVQVIDGVLQRGGGAVVVFGRHEHVPVEGRDLRGPPLGVRMAVAAERRRNRLIQQRQLVVRDVDQLEAGVSTLRGKLECPARYRDVVAAGTGASGNDGDIHARD